MPDSTTSLKVMEPTPVKSVSKNVSSSTHAAHFCLLRSSQAFQGKPVCSGKTCLEHTKNLMVPEKEKKRYSFNIQRT
ncbi:hypothetical protein NDU88_007445 [Pleurodeles waltl]|uniref:Uncharacterized protein n=1 Tax=Pleurodeles waltl TaxID=8319 RepID=A0AAV7QRY9_PLEWA|nr:hypothetical protein NDU88_007445 [Pleurodeles waltl]